MAVEQRALIAVDTLGFLDQMGQNLLREIGALIAEQRDDHVLVLGFDQRFRNVFLEIVAHGDAELMLKRAMANDVDQILVV